MFFRFGFCSMVTDFSEDAFLLGYSLSDNAGLVNARGPDAERFYFVSHVSVSFARKCQVAAGHHKAVVSCRSSKISTATLS